MDLHSLPPQGDIRPSQLMAKLTNTLPHGTPTNTDLFYSFFMYRMPQYLREVLAANEYATARDMAAAADRVWDLPQSAPTAAVAAAYQPREQSASPRQRGGNSDRGSNSDRSRSQSQRRGRAQTPHTQEFPDNGTTTTIKIGHNVAEIPAIGTAPMPRRETVSPTARAHGPSGRRPPRPLSNSHSNGNVFFARLRFNVFERFLQPIKFLSRLRSLTEYNTLFFFPNATWPKIAWSKWRRHSHLGISNKNHQNWHNTI
jgi:hypothetical protein